MAYCIFTNCFSVLGTGLTQYTSLDVRSGVGMTTSVGQVAFLGSSDATGPLGLIVQHICSNSVCRLDLTSTRNGVSGNDLSLNIDSGDPNTAGGGLYIKYKGNVGIGTSSPDTLLHIRNCVNGGTNNFLLTLQNTCTVADARAGIAFLDNSNTAGGSGISGASIQVANNGIDGTGHLLFSSLLNGAVTERMRINSGGCVGIGTTSPSTPLQIRSNTIDSGGAGLSVFGFDGAVEFTTTRAESPANAAIYLYNRPTSGINGTGTGISFRASSTNTADRPQGGFYSSWTDSTDATRTSKFFFDLVNSGTYATRMTLLGNGNLGIGTTVACTRLSVRCSTGGAKIDLLSLTTTDGAGSQPTLRFDTIEANCNVLGRISVCDVAPYAGTMIFEVSPAKGAGSTTTSEVMRLVGTTGNVGIGTTSPSYRLQVSGDEGAIHARVNSDGVGANLHIRPNAGRCGWVSFTEDAVADRWGIGIKNGDGALYFASGNVVVGGGTTRMILTSTGAIGLGTSSPASRLHITHTGAQGACTIILQSTDSCGNGTISWRTSAGVTQAQIGSNYNVGDNGGNLELITSAATRLLVTSAGRIGMGVTAPNHTLSLDGNVGVVGYNWKLQSDGDGNWGFGLCNCGTTYYTYLTYAADATADRRGGIFNVAGNNWIAYGNCVNNFIVTNCVGVATTTPTYRLHVNGTFYAAGSSIKYKEGICHYDTNSCLFMCLKPVTYQYKDEWKHLGKELKSDIQIGLIAEDVADVMPELAVLVNEEDEKVVRNVDYEKLSIVLLAEVQKLRREVDTLKNN